jgi:3-oxoacyl-[acyl-carrier-protein] synthase-1/3-oxoacyl-[acyl-carrier-protein] synthase II
MIRQRVFIAGMGIVSALGSGVAETHAALAAGLSGLKPLGLFATPEGAPHPVGEVDLPPGDPLVPRTHRLARIAADQAMVGCREAPGAVIIGTTTGGMAISEELLKAKRAEPDGFTLHAAGSVAEDIARRHGCRGPVLTVSTACSSGAVAIALALAMVRRGLAASVLAGGADGLCRLTYHGFNALKLIDPEGARPLDGGRRGMSVAEGAGMLLLSAGDGDPPAAGIEILGAGLSCDAHHPAAPHPEGRGAYAAMAAALADAGLEPSAVDYVNLHGTGTPDNDLAEARAVGRLFADACPAVSSVKGASGHALAAAGAVEAVIAAICIEKGLIPGTTGLRRPDPALALDPAAAPRTAPVATVLSNSFGFGGNNAALVVGAPAGRAAAARPGARGLKPMPVAAAACVTGAGATDRTFARLAEGGSCRGLASADEIAAQLAARQVRRLKYLPRLVLALADEARRRSGRQEPPGGVYFGTGWGALSETHGFLESLFESGERFPSPTDFVGSVHNSPAGQAAIMLGADGPNVTATGGDCSFEQALLAACLLEKGKGRGTLVIGADEYHPAYSRLFDASVRLDEAPAAGGGAIFLAPEAGAADATIFPACCSPAEDTPESPAALVQALGGADRIGAHFGLVLAGIPAACRQAGQAQLKRFLEASGIGCPVVDYRKITGEFASASAVAAALGVIFTGEGRVPAALCGAGAGGLAGKGVLVLGFGKTVSAMEILPR